MPVSRSKEVALFVPCFVDQLWPSAGRAAVRIIEALGRSVFVADVLCCSQVFGNAGEEGMASRQLRLFEEAHTGCSQVLVLSASCAGYLQERVKDLEIVEICAWLRDHCPERFEVPVDKTLALHSSCSALRETKTASAARDLLARVPGLRVREPSQPDECCGFGGSFATGYPELSVKMGRDKLADLLPQGHGIDGLVSMDCSCLLHLQALGQEALSYQHVVEVLAEALP